MRRLRVSFNPGVIGGAPLSVTLGEDTGSENGKDTMRVVTLLATTFLASGLALSTGCMGSTNKSQDVLDIACAPKQIEEGETTTLTILQISPEPLTRIVALKQDALINAAYHGMIMASASGPGSPSAYRLQVINIQPLPGQRELQLGPADFENLPSGFIMRPIQIKVLPGGRDAKPAPGQPGKL